MRLAPFLTAFLLGIGATLAATGAASKELPPSPRYYVLDEPHALTPQALRALETILVDHDRLTGEQIVIAIFNSLDGEDLAQWTNDIFQKWRIGQRGKDNGVLLALYWKEHRSRIEVGYGLEPLLTDAKSEEILSDVLAPELKAGRNDRALALATLEILRVIGSPLIQSGEAGQILRSAGSSLRGPLAPDQSPPTRGSTVVWLVLGLILFIIVMNANTSAEAHFTGSGWYRPRPWRRGRFGAFGGPFLGGGGFGGGAGGGFGGGGFIGGGGSSGGGGASGGW